MSEGYLKLHRQILDSDVFASQKMLKIWVWCLCRANYKKRSVPCKTGRGETIVTLNPGEFIFGRYKAEEELNIDGSTIYKIMKQLESIGNITIKSNSHYSIITICNWDKYQILEDSEVTSNEQASNKQVTTNEQPSNTDNKVKNIKKDNKELYLEWRTLSKNEDYIFIIDYILGENHTGKPLEFVLKMQDQMDEESFKRLYIIAQKYGTRITDKLTSLEEKQRSSNGKKYKSLNLTLGNWLKNNFK